MLLGAVELSRDDKDYTSWCCAYKQPAASWTEKVTSVTNCTRICVQITFSFQVMFGRSLLLYEVFQNDFCKQGVEFKSIF